MLYAARFPDKVRKMVIAGAPIDISADDSPITSLAATVPLSLFEQLVKSGQGRVLGQRAFSFWGSPALDQARIAAILQRAADAASPIPEDLAERFRRWYVTTVDLPGTYYLQVVDWLFKQNRIARGEFVALGRRIDLSQLRLPTFLLAARDDEYVGLGQALAAARLLGTRKSDIRRAIAPCSHLSLFMGAATLTTIWPSIVRWLTSERAPKAKPRKGSFLVKTAS
jgi:poly-beta-hydroxyalkanoate depolymerase